MSVYIANFGRENSYWPQCLKRSSVAAFNDEDLHPFWLAGDRDGWIAYCIAHKRTAAGISPTKPIASRWFNLMHVVVGSVGDIWFHRQKNEVWWTTTSDEAAVFELIDAFEPDNDGTRHFVANKPCKEWSNKSPTGILAWSSLHPKAREFLFTEGTLQQLAEDNADYARALVGGDDLRPWHDRVAWKQKAETAKKPPTLSFNPRQRAALRMMKTAVGTVAGAKGQEVTRVAKVKELRLSETELLAYIEALISAQDGLCALTGIQLQFDGQQDDDELLCSLDRIDSDGHYEAGNLQIVCRFTNRWKGADKDALFRRLLGLVRSST